MHCSLQFLTAAEKTWIIILCLPPHTTHVLQPCDVGVFSPLATFYKKEVMNISRHNIRIEKTNFLDIYAKARKQAFKISTISTAFRKCGLWPYNSEIFSDVVFAPALNMTIQSAQPLTSTSISYVNTSITEYRTESQSKHFDIHFLDTPSTL